MISDLNPFDGSWSQNPMETLMLIEMKWAGNGKCGKLPLLEKTGWLSKVIDTVKSILERKSMAKLKPIGTKLETAKFRKSSCHLYSNDALLCARTGYRNDSRVHLEFLFERQTGFFLLQIYTPLTLIVFCSWVSFWLVKTEAVRKPLRVYLWSQGLVY